MIALRGIYIIWLREVIRFRRDPSRIVGMIAQPLLYLLLVGNGISHGLQLRSAHGANYMAYMFPGIVGMSVLFTSVFGAVSIVWDREFGFLKEVLVSPVPRWTIAMGKALGGATIALLQGAILIFLAPLVGLSLGFGEFFALLGVLALVSMALVGLGLLIASRMSSMQGFQMIMNFLVMPLFFLSGALYPLKGMPAWLGTLMRIDPLTYGVDALRHIVYGVSSMGTLLTQFPLARDLAVTAAFAAILITLSSWAFHNAKAV